LGDFDIHHGPVFKRIRDEILQGHNPSQTVPSTQYRIAGINRPY
jgi:hypothetical protein